ncbi:branched-chain amino acid ABC transporter permease [Skermanella rosea]|uniref:branched-chain amino acid ABC transporter permease n=1 Tax=Skermanella rosea TaxID=1817965 RepID=UPI0019344A1A|nr:branched-chain amino acid ABC transporter permease [Skermanella rosea]UEM01327.1 branched-chain amino acid ABC transporter permease [Skermanella rosea]
MRALPYVVIAACYAVVPFALGGNDYIMSLVVAALTLAGIALSWALLGNLGGMVSFGHAAFFGVGAYTSAILAKDMGMPVFLAMLAGGIGAALVSVVTMPALRLRGPYFALAILAYAQIFRILANEMTWLTGGAGGILSIPPLPTVFGFDFSGKTGAYLVILTLLVLGVLAYKLIRDSYWGLALKAMHDSEDATRVIGVPSTLLKAAMLVVSAFMAGVVGAFNAHVIGFLEPDYAFAGTWSVIPVVAAIFGGYRTLSGPILGALVIYLLDQLLFKNLMPQGHQIMFGVLLGAMILFSPSGLLPLLTRPFARSRSKATTTPTSEKRHAAAA